jgi:GT2 family glycosyltransferase
MQTNSFSVRENLDCSSILVIVLNWNGWADTIECCESLRGLKPAHDVLVFDNGSDNDSVQKLSEYFASFALECEDESLIINGLPLLVKRYDCSGVAFRLCCLSDNLGFSGGCNLAVKYAEFKDYKYSVLLNNDTVLAADSLQIMHDVYCSSHADIVIPQIRYFDRPDVIWNCGGEVSRWGYVRYYFSGGSGSALNIDEVFKVGFATGCCMLFETKFFNSMGGFTERFFFGEEDVELSFRLRRSKALIVCAGRSIIYHKVGASIRGKDELIFRKSFIHYLNRFINMRDQLPFLVWNIWRFAMIFKVFFTLRKNFGKSISEIYSFVKLLMEKSSSLKAVDRHLFRSVLDGSFKFK